MQSSHTFALFAAAALVACTSNGGADDVAADAATEVSADADETEDALDATADDVEDEPEVGDASTEEPTEPEIRDAADDGVLDFREINFCEEVGRFAPIYEDTVQRLILRDNTFVYYPGGVVFVGSSSIRRWETLARDFADYQPIQRGIGGAQMGEIAYWADPLVTRYQPSAVVVFAGTNDIAFFVEPEVVVDRFRCLRQSIGSALGWNIPVFYIGITPTPSRWAIWSAASEVNDAIKALEAIDPAMHYIDVPAAFLATGEPPVDDLFVDDRLHLSAQGYAIWSEVIREALDAELRPPDFLRAAELLPETRILIDLGSNGSDAGESTPGPDYLNQIWNNWHDTPGGADVLPGERLGLLVTTGGGYTSAALTVAGGLTTNFAGARGVRFPTEDNLGSLAVDTATSDYFAASSDDVPGALVLSGLDHEVTYTLRLFAGRDFEQRQVTQYTVVGASTRSASIQTSGAGAGDTGGNANNHNVAVFEGVQTTEFGTIFIDLTAIEGTTAYIAAIELIVE